MPQAVQGTTTDFGSFPGTRDFLALLDGKSAQWSAMFNYHKPLFVSRAPGRMDVMGGIADYSGALVLQMPIQEACFAAVQMSSVTQDPQLQVVSLSDDTARSPSFSTPLSTLYPNGTPLSYAAAQKLFKADPSSSWAAYILGCLLVLSHERNVSFQGCSVSILVSSSVPEGKGVSSSASVEVAVMQGLLAALGLSTQLPGREVAVLCQKVENLVVGAPCGIMDQMASALGDQGMLLALLCQPAEVQGCVRIPSHLAVWGIDSGVRHSVGGSDYGSVRVGAFMGLKITQAARAQRTGDAAGAGPAHLVHISPSQYEAWLQDHLPVSCTGSEFLDKYGPHLDTVTSVNPDQEYAVRQPAAHAICEHARVQLYRQLLQAPPSQEQGLMLGELMFQSHASYGRCRLGSPGTDRLVQLVRQHVESSTQSGSTPLLYGAKITGGGCGGTVCILGQASSEADQLVQLLAHQYWQETGLQGSPKIFTGSSGGAVAFGHLVVQVDALEKA